MKHTFLIAVEVEYDDKVSTPTGHEVASLIRERSAGSTPDDYYWITSIKPGPVRVEIEAVEPMELLRNLSPVFVRQATAGIHHGFGTVELLGDEKDVVQFMNDNWDPDHVELVLMSGGLM